MMPYNMEYKDGSAQQVGGPVEPKVSPGPEIGKTAWYKHFRLPSVAVTAAAAMLTTGVWFSVEAFAPERLTPSYNVGRYEARVEARVDAYKLQQQQKIDRLNAVIKLHNDQAQAKFQTQAQAIADNYRANYEMRKVALQGVIQLTQQWQAARYAQVQRTQSADNSMANLAKTWGLFANILSPSSGDAAIEYSEERKREMLAELQSAAGADSPVNMDMFGTTDLPTPEEVVEMLERLRPTPMPMLPNIGEDVALYPADANEGSGQ